MKADLKRLRDRVSFLTNIKPPRNYRNIDSLNRVADFINLELGGYGCEVVEQTFKVDGHTYRNVIGSIGPKEASRIVVGAHYDVAGDQPGADDNASAVAGLLETARLMEPYQHRLKKRIDFVAYSLEEPPFFGSPSMGSAVHARSLYEEGVPVELMICFEMIGYFTDKRGSQSYPASISEESRPDRGNFITVVGIEKFSKLADKLTNLMQRYAKVKVEGITFSSYHGLPGLSDHKNYWEHGYPAIMITDTSFLRNPHYHQESDTIETLDFFRMAEVINGVSGALVEMAKGE